MSAEFYAGDDDFENYDRVEVLVTAINKRKYFDSYLGMAEASRFYSARLLKGWNDLKDLHKEHRVFSKEENREKKEVPCFICPTKDDDILDLLDIVDSLEDFDMEEAIIAIFKFIEEHSSSITRECYERQFQYATDMMYYWKGLNGLLFSPSPKKIYLRSAGFRNPRKKEGFYYVCFPNKKDSDHNCFPINIENIVKNVNRNCHDE